MCWSSMPEEETLKGCPGQELFVILFSRESCLVGCLGSELNSTEGMRRDAETANS